MDTENDDAARTGSMAPASRINSDIPANRPHSYQQNNVIQNNGHYHGFNPMQAPFQPVESGLQRYEIPRTLHIPPQHNQLLDLVAEHKIHQIIETSRLEHKHRGLAQEVERIREIFRNDLRTLEEKIATITLAPDARSTQDRIEAASAKDEYEYYWTGPKGIASEAMLKHYSQEQIANSYIDEAEKREASCEENRLFSSILREQAYEMCPRLREQMPSSHLLIEAAPIAAHRAAPPRFACCCTEFSTISELVEHVRRAHTAPEHRLLSKAVDNKTPPASANGRNPIQPAGETLIADADLESAKQDITGWTPMVVRKMPAVQITVPVDAETFTFEFLRTTFGGENWSPGYYFIPKNSMLPSQSYWILDVQNEPYLPQEPGAHGAKLTAFFNESSCVAGQAPDPENFLNVPVFIKSADQDEYSYYGNYSQSRFSDKIGYDTMTEHIPESALRFHAEQLAEIGRPAWITQALKEHFWSRPKYYGPIPTDSALNTPATSADENSKNFTGLERRVQRALTDYAADLKEWEKDSNVTVSLLTADTIFRSFSAADADAEPGLRPYWEYFQCESWDHGFYDMLVGLKQSPITKLEMGSAGKRRRPSPERKNGSTAGKMGFSAQATFKSTKTSKPKPKDAPEYPGPAARTQFVKTNIDELPVALVGGKKGDVGNGCGRRSR